MNTIIFSGDLVPLFAFFLVINFIENYQINVTVLAATVFPVVLNWVLEKKVVTQSYPQKQKFISNSRVIRLPIIISKQIML